MTCSKYVPMLSRLLDSELSCQETVEVEDHLKHCTDCRSLEEAWRRQGVMMRGHLSRHRLDDDFVARVTQTALTQTSSAAGPRPVPKRLWLRWLPVAASVLFAAVAISLFIGNRGNEGYARVIEPGALEVLQSGGWVRASAGELLSPGAWLRNPVEGVPKLLWRDSCQLTLDAGTLVHLPDITSHEANQVALISGSLSSEVRAGGADFQVSTPAGSVTTSGSISVRVADLALPQLRVAEGGGEILTGTVVSIGEVRVSNGPARVDSAQLRQEVRAGTTAMFGASQLSNLDGRIVSVEASLRVVANTADGGTLRASLHPTSDGIWTQLEFSNLRLRRLLQLTTGAEVRGGEDTSVAGRILIPAHADDESVASAAGAALGLPISFRHEQVNRAVGVGRFNPAGIPADNSGEFSCEKSPEGRISFDFRSVPAGRVFQILRSVADTLPELSAETAAVPVSIRAVNLGSAETAAWIEKTLGLEFRRENLSVGVIEIGSPSAIAPRPGAAGPGPQREPSRQEGSTDKITVMDIGSPAGNGKVSMMSLAQDTFLPQEMVVPQPEAAGRPLWSILDHGVGAAGILAASGSSKGGQSESTGGASPKKRQFYGAAELLGKPGASTHIIWPTLGLENAAGAEPVYVVTNFSGLTTRAMWNGYDSTGQLIAQYEFTLNGHSALSLLPGRDLPSYLGAGGHWETFSPVPLVGARDETLGDGLGLPAVPEHLKSQWAIPSAWLNLGARIWLANPTGERASVIVEIVESGSAIATEQLEIPPHAGSIWPEDVPAIRAGLTIIVSVKQGVVASGLR